jgi:hypothetical protein
MIRFALLTGLAALAACASNAPKAPDQVAEAQCESAAYDTPEVKRLIQLRVSTALNNNDLLPDQRDAVRTATRKCMQQKGLAPPGGVERVRTKPDYLQQGS